MNKNYHNSNSEEIARRQYKYWFFTLNNPEVWLGTKDPEQIQKIMAAKFAHYRYVYQLERGEKEGTLHLQGCILNDVFVRGITLMNKFRKEIEGQKKTGIYLQQARNIQAAYCYCTKAKTRVAGPYTHEPANPKIKEDGAPTTLADLVDVDMTYEQYKANKKEGLKPGARHKDMKTLYASIINEGMDMADIHSDPELSIIAGHYPAYVQQLLQHDMEVKFKANRNATRDISVTWLYGSPGAGKTEKAFELAGGYDKAYKISNSNYKDNPWDNYKGQDAVIFDEFYGDVKFSHLMELWDEYPLQLSARYNNKWACYTKVFVCSNLAPWELYKNLDNREYRINGLYRRIHKLIYVSKQDDGTRSYEDRTNELAKRLGLDIEAEDQQQEYDFL